MSVYKIVFSTEAKNDFTKIVHYIKYNLQEPTLDKKLVQKFKKRIYNLGVNPKIFSIIDDHYIKNLKLRKLVINNYIVFYRVLESGKEVQIVRIVYGRMNWKDFI